MLKLGWTLNYEMFFYLAFALLIALRPVTRTVALATTFCCIVAAVAFIHPSSAPPKFWGSPIILEFLFGCAIGCADLRLLPAAGARWIWLSTAALGTIAFLVLGAVDTTLASRIEMRGFPGALIVFSAIALERSSPIPRRNGFLHFLGDASYSIYLSHLFAIVILRAIWLELEFPSAEPWNAAVFTVAAMIIGTGFGCLVHIILERPLTRLARGFATRPPAFPNPSPVGNA